MRMYAVAMLSSRLLRVCLLTSVSFGATFITCSAEEAHFPTSDDLRHLKGIGGPQLSPDGKLVLVTIKNATADGGKSHLWLVAAAGRPVPEPWHGYDVWQRMIEFIEKAFASRR
jgi:hypothetical protein